MPIYTFQCVRCREAFDRLQRMDDPNPRCQSCGFAHTTKLPSGGNFVLKGSGWYKTDFKDKSGRS